MTFISNHIKYLVIHYFADSFFDEGKLNRAAYFPFVNPFSLKCFCFSF